MRLITRAMRAAEAAEKWAGQYGEDPDAAELRMPNGKTRAAILAELRALGPSPDPDAVDEAIGNGSWTRLSCDECGACAAAVVEAGEEPDYESRTVHLCNECVGKAAAVVKAAAP